jgi:hypothetical protein
MSLMFSIHFNLRVSVGVELKPDLNQNQPNMSISGM